MKDSDLILTPDLLLQGYKIGIFPMSEGRDDPEVFWVDPKLRGILPLNSFHISQSLRKTLRKSPFQISFNKAFIQTVQGCADRDETWINDTIFDLYGALHARNQAHSVEIWDKNTLVGGVYGVSIGGAFFGESMFSRTKNASKIALAYLVDRLKTSGFALCDTQFITPHLASLGGIEITRETYQNKLAAALKISATFDAQTPPPSGQDVIQRNGQTS